MLIIEMTISLKQNVQNAFTSLSVLTMISLAE